LTALSILFLIAFIASLVLAVIAMLHGVEYTRPKSAQAPSPFFNLPSYAAFGFGFGVVGYLLATRTSLADWVTLVMAAIAGSLAVAGMVTLLATWALRGTTAPSDDHEIQGQLAIVTRDIQLGGSGEIRYEVFGKQIRIAARAISGNQLSVGSEVVIDRVDNGVAMVEEWAIVEQRL
jgi:membrane protein implicated in regulation of membrane protease activity